MEAAGLTVGVVALAGIFQTCIELFSNISSAKALGHDYELLETKLDTEKLLLLRWAHCVRIFDQNYNPYLEDEATRSAIERILSAIKALLTSAQTLENDYGLKPSTADQSHLRNVAELSQAGNPSALSQRRMENLVEATRKFATRTKTRQKQAHSLGKFKWVVRDREKFERLVHELSHFVTKLRDLVPYPENRGSDMNNTHSKSGRLQEMLPEDIGNLEAPGLLRLVQEASDDNCANIATLAQRVRKDQCEQKILDCLWYRTMHERKKDIKEAHTNTFSWSLESSYDNSDWSNLANWFKGNNGGNFWLFGKVGSGKSTLMRYLFDSSKTHQLLSEWADGVPLTIGSFFFWHIGSEDKQKSKEGMLRALLFDIFESDKSLIQKLLPTLWSEAYKHGANINPPSLTEMKTAIDLLVQGPANRKYCFFIDGLDECDGEYTELIEIIQTLTTCRYTKVIASSRPYAAFVEAFQNQPSLQLQDLTVKDIKAYVDDKVVHKTRMQHLLQRHPREAEEMIDSLIRKASGVFLWVVLACQSINDGLASYDRIADLQERVQELPEELEHLYLHLMSKIPPRYRVQAAQLLRICYEHFLDGQTKPLSVYGSLSILNLAFIENREMKIESIYSTDRLTRNEHKEICEELRGRLRSRCLGLLEIRPFVRPRTLLCVCEHDRLSDTHDELLDSNVNFLHRSVYDFLDTPDIWETEALSLPDDFQAKALITLSYLYITKFQLSKKLELVEFNIRNTFYRAACVLNEGEHHALITILNDLSKLIKDKDNDAIKRRCNSTFWTWRMATKEHFMLLLAVECGIVPYVEYYCKTWGISPSRPGMKNSLLYHAVKRPITAKWRTRWSERMLEFLLSSGCDPNEARAYDCDKRELITPFCLFLSNMRCSTLEESQKLSKNLRLFLSYGASPFTSWCYSMRDEKMFLEFKDERESIECKGERVSIEDCIRAVFIDGFHYQKLTSRERRELSAEGQRLLCLVEDIKATSDEGGNTRKGLGLVTG